MIFIIKVQTNKEDRAVEMVSERIEKKEIAVYSVLRPHGLRGYIILESEDRDSAEEAVYNLPYIKGIIGKTQGVIKETNPPNKPKINITQ
jgi:transcription elongation factor Spt5